MKGHLDNTLTGKMYLKASQFFIVNELTEFMTIQGILIVSKFDTK